VPVGQTGDVLVLHRAQQRLALRAALETIGCRQVVEQERQVIDLDALA